MIASPEVQLRLELARVLEMIAAGTRTPMGRDQALSLAPVDEPGDALRAQDRAAGMRRVLAERGRLPLVAVEDPGGVLDELAVAGRTLPGREIFETVRLLVVAREVAAFLRALDPDAVPALAGEWARFPELEGVVGAIEGDLSPAGFVEDGASPELGRVRRDIRQLSERLTETLQKILRAEAGGPVLQDDFITVRNNRFVLPVRTDAPRRFSGIVHATSGTSHTLFIEPMETVEINNQLVALKDEEQREVERILTMYTELLRAAREEIAETARVLGELDRLEAIARWADAVRAVRPDLQPGGGLRLRRARHPVLEATLAAASPPRAMVPVDVDLPRELRALVISGPNAGGKTVALKTIGLVALMAHAGLPVPADEAAMPLFSRIDADIGDEQSIAESLSTFASHVKNLAAVLAGAVPPALALIDEIGTGTDPAEGAALGTAALDRLVQRGVHVVATTHHAAIKAWAYRAPGALNAACDFDQATLRPTYRLVPGVAGASIGLTMAEQLGLDREIVEEARRRLDPAGVETAGVLDAVRSLASDLETRRAELTETRRRLEREAEERETARRADEEKRRAEWTRRVEELTRAFRAEAEKMLKRLDDVRERRLLDRERAARERELKERFAEEVAAARRIEPPPAAWQPEEGGKVFVASLGREGVIRGISGHKAEVRLGAAIFTIPLDDLRPPGAPAAPAAAAPRGPRTAAARPGASRPLGRSAEAAERAAARELILLGYRVDEALDAVDKALDEAQLAGLTELRLVHGFGTGALKKAVREHVSAHPEVVSWRDGRPDEGGGGATVVALRTE
ncbi:MAG: Smr/MutS family protein [Acidobacteria bacterium]|nr:Smr/MutS family protein [Acidobacteriota bacterium]